MKAYTSYFQITKVNNEYKILASKKSNKANDNLLKDIISFSYSLFNDYNFIEINNKLLKISFLKYDNEFVIIYVSPDGLDKLNNNKYILRILEMDELDNPFRFFYDSNIILLNDNKDIIFDTDFKFDIYKLLENKINISSFSYLLDLIINNIDNDLTICINCQNELIPIYLCLIGYSLPKLYLNKLTYTYGTNKLLFNTKLFFLGMNKYLKYDNTIYVDINKNYNIELSRYVNQYISYFESDINDARIYKETIEELMIKHNIDILRASRLRNLINGNISSFIKTKNLKMAIEDSNYLYDNNLISSAIYINLNKFDINHDILLIYKYIYDYVESSHDKIIELFFNNLDKFGINKKAIPYDFINLVINNVPFDLKDYYSYLINHSLYEETKKESFNMNLVVLVSLCRYIKYNKLSIIPNKELEDYIKDIILDGDINNLDLVLDEIKKLHKNARSRLLYYSLLSLEKDNHNLCLKLGIDYYILVLERIDPIDSYNHFIKLFKSNNETFILEKFKIRISRNKEFYDKLFTELDKHDFSLIKDRIDYKNDLEYKILDINDLDIIYHKNYLNKNINTDGIFISKIFEYLDKVEYNNRVLEAINIFNKYFKDLNDNYKDKIDSIRRLNNYIYDYPNQVFKNDIDIYNELFIMDNTLYKYKRYNDNPVFDLLRFGLDLKKAYLDDKFRNSFFRPLLIKNNTYFNDEINEYLIKYYLRFLMFDFYKIINNPIEYDNDLLLICGYHSLFDSLTNYNDFKTYFIHLFNELDNNDKKLQLMQLMLFSLNQDNDIYKEIVNRIITDIEKPIKLFKEYYKLIDKLKWAKKLKENFKNFIDSYIIENTNIFKRLIWRYFKK